MTDLLTERVARAICETPEEAALTITKYDALPENWQEPFRKAAHAAILETLRGTREPSEGMIEAGWKPSDFNPLSDKYPVVVYQAMIDTLIAELEPPCDT